ncbi:MAG: sigma-70 family RNA polymerase sigma factor [Muribaculum sp.]|nr:sigma-70 family RNA polymerase sigma factor [Muribaculum sp.]
MADQEIIQGLIERDNHITHQFFYVKCRPLLTAIMRLVFSYPVEYDEMVSELYDYLMGNDGLRLRQFQFRSTIYQWMKVVATRFFIHRRDSLIENISNEPLYERHENDELVDTAQSVARKIDVARMLSMMKNKRYADVIRHLILQDEEPEKYAESIGVTVDNLYNIKRRAIAAISRIAITYYSYGR